MDSKIASVYQPGNWMKRNASLWHRGYVNDYPVMVILFAEADFHVDIVNTTVPNIGFVREYSHNISVDILMRHLQGASVPISQTGGNFNVTLFLGLSSTGNSTLIPHGTNIKWTLAVNGSFSVSDTLHMILQADVKIPMSQCHTISRLCLDIAAVSQQLYVELNTSSNMACFNISTVCRPSKFTPISLTFLIP